MFAYITSSPILFMQIHGLTEGQFGLAFSFCAFCLIVGSQFNRMLLRNRSASTLAELTGAAILFIAAALFILTAFSIANFAVTIVCIALFLFLL